MSNTPRTDAKESESDSGGMERHAYYGWKFARQLERELAKMTEAVGLATTCVPDMEINIADPVGMMQRVCAEYAKAKSQSDSREAELKAEALEEAARYCHSRIGAGPPPECYAHDLEAGAIAGWLFVRTSEYREKVKPLGEKP